MTSRRGGGAEKVWSPQVLCLVLGTVRKLVLAETNKQLNFAEHYIAEVNVKEKPEKLKTFTSSTTSASLLFSPRVPGVEARPPAARRGPPLISAPASGTPLAGEEEPPDNLQP